MTVSKTPTHQIPAPWSEFLSAVNDALPEPVEIHCVGGFVLAVLYNLPRPTSAPARRRSASIWSGKVYCCPKLIAQAGTAPPGSVCSQ